MVVYHNSYGGECFGLMIIINYYYNNYYDKTIHKSLFTKNLK